MRKLVLALGVSTAAFAASTLYFWRELQVERSTPQLVASEPAMVSAKDTPDQPSPAPGSSAAMSQPATVPVARNRPDAETARTEAETDAEARARSLAQMRAVFEDPLKREEMMRVSRDGFRGSFPRLAEHLGLTEDQYTRLVNQLAEHQMHWAERRYRCLLEPGCDEMTAMKGIGAERERELTDILGPENYQQFNEYLDNQQERRAVMRLRGELPDTARLSDAQLEKLIAALGDERRRAQQRWEQSGVEFSSQGTASGTLIVSSTAKTVDERIADAQEFQRLQLERAGQILTATQLQAFRQIQEQDLRQLRQIWEHEVPSANDRSN
jgi:hypothetical protein